MESQMEFPELRNKDDGYNVRGSHMASTGKDPFSEPFKGEVIGTASIDPKTKAIKITIFSPPDDTKDPS